MTESGSTELALLDLERDEQIIERGLVTFVEVGNAFVAIRDGKKYRAAGHRTFEDYCDKRWGFSRTHAYELMAAAETAALLSAAADIPQPQSERQLRGLAPLSDADKPKAWADAVEEAGGGQPTGPQVSQAAAKYRPSRVDVVDKARGTLADAAPDDDPAMIEAEAEAIADTVEAEPEWMAQYSDDEMWCDECDGRCRDRWNHFDPDPYDPSSSFVDDAIAECIESKRVPQPQPKPDLGAGVSHPARYSDELFPHFVELLDGYHHVLDPFAGTGKIFQLREHGHLVAGNELEPEWATMHPDTVIGDALSLPFDDAMFDAICTSPTYGNRLADHHNAYDPEARRSYTHDLGRQLHPNNSGAMQWGPDYREFHETAWVEAVRVLRSGGRFVLNLKDHIRGGAWQDVLGWHVATLLRLDLEVVAVRPVATRSLPTGSTAGLRVDAEMIVAFDKVAR